MSRHLDTHPTPVPDCWRCRMGVGRRSTVVAVHQITQGRDPVRRVPVVADDGPTRGRVAGWHTEHMDGRQDATVIPGAIAVRATTTQEG